MLAGAVALPPVVEGGAALILLLTWLVALGLLHAYRATIRRILLAVADELDGVSLSIFGHRKHLFGPISSAIRWADDQVTHALGALAIATERPAVWLFHMVTRQLSAIGDEIGGLAYDVARRFTHTAEVTLPNLRRHVDRRIAAAVAGLAAIAATVHGTVAVDLPHLRREVADVRGYTRRLLRRLRRVERLLAPAAFAAAVAVALGRLGLRVLRCPQFLRAARRTCGMSPDLLESLLADTLLILGPLSLVEFAEEMQSITGEISSVIHHLIREA